MLNVINVFLSEFPTVGNYNKNFEDLKGYEINKYGKKFIHLKEAFYDFE